MTVRDSDFSSAGVKTGLSIFLLAATLLDCADTGPSSPSPTEPAAPAPASTPSPAPGGTLSGRVSNLVTGAPVAGATVTVSGIGAVSTSSDGAFRVEVTPGESVSIVVAAPGYWTRETRIRPVVATAPPVALDLLPDGNDFDLEFFDHVFREVGADGTHRWTYEPELEIWDGVYDCSAYVEGEGCEQLIATAERAPDGFVQTMRRVIESDARKYTDGHVVGSFISTRSHPSGTSIAREGFLERGKVTFALVLRPDNFSWAYWRFASEGSMLAGHVQVNRKHKDSRGVYSHELAHTLGFGHPRGLDQVPLASIMRRGHGSDPTRFDILHGRVLYLRPPDSRTPDVDPARFVLNGLREGSSADGGEITRSAQ
jgi:hypothetical protein